MATRFGYMMWLHLKSTIIMATRFGYMMWLHFYSLFGYMFRLQDVVTFVVHYIMATRFGYMMWPHATLIF